MFFDCDFGSFSYSYFYGVCVFSLDSFSDFELDY